MEHLTLNEVDADGAIQELAEKVEGLAECVSAQGRHRGRRGRRWRCADGRDPVARVCRQRPVDE